MYRLFDCLWLLLKRVESQNHRIKIFKFQGTPAKHETPTKAEEAKPTDSKDKENIYPSFTENKDSEKTSIVNETFEVKSAGDTSAKPEAAENKSDKYSSIALLDDEQEEEKWEERTTVITKTDHEGYVAAASAILQDVKTPVKR